MPRTANIPRYKAVKPQSQARVKQRFVSSVLSETAVEIRDKQQQVVQEWNLFASGELKRMLEGHFSVDNAEGGAKLSMSYLVYARFLDLKDKRRNVQRQGFNLYNRIVFGILYNKTLGLLKYGFTDDVKEVIANNVDAAMTGDRNAAARITKKLREGYF